MLEKYAPRFENLTPEQTGYLTAAVARRHPQVLDHGTPEPTPLWDLCTRAGLDQADVVMSLSRDCTVQGVQVIETLVGQPIIRTPPERPRSSRPRRGPVRSVTERIREDLVIVSIAPNPKKPGSAARERFALYRDGMTVAEALDAGLSRADMKWDAERNFITLEDRS